MKLHVEPIPPKETKPWILKRHYAHRMPQIQYSFGLYTERICIGICAFGMPANRNNAKMGEFDMWELVRLVVEDGNPNGASFLIAKSLKMMPSPCAVISYADTGAGHIGYIYQATNWLYTGVSKGGTEWVIDGARYHNKNVHNIYGTNSVETIKALGHTVETYKLGDKHRYLNFVGSRKQKREMRASVHYPILPYPKGETKRYDAGASVIKQPLLFT